MEKINKPDYMALLTEAITNPGKLSEAYSLFWHYSGCNQMLAMLQLGKAEPINTYRGWLALGRQVQSGAKAIALYMPISFTPESEKSKPKDEQKNQMAFVMKKNWFGLSATKGEDFKPAEMPEFSTAQALEKLGIDTEEFASTDGNIQGYAHGNKIAINPLNKSGQATIFHEIAHILLGHTTEMQFSTAITPRDIREVEAEGTAYIVGCTLNTLSSDQKEERRGYLQSWLNGKSVEEKSIRKMFSAADKIIKAGQVIAN